ncbi:MAG: hypothetical protein WBQ76_03030 [Candidatus Korobacteraceae bacterium]
MKLHWIGTLSVVLAGALMLASEPATNPQRGQHASTTPDVWGGHGVSMKVTPQGATLEFDCAHGNMLEPIKANAKGEFTARGTYTPERDGPISRDNSPRDLPATYKGSIDGDTMRLEIMLAEKDQAPEPFTLTRGKVGRLVKCR